jgi:hypothetical protein
VGRGRNQAKIGENEQTWSRKSSGAAELPNGEKKKNNRKGGLVDLPSALAVSRAVAGGGKNCCGGKDSGRVGGAGIGPEEAAKAKEPRAAVVWAGFQPRKNAVHGPPLSLLARNGRTALARWMEERRDLFFLVRRPREEPGGLAWLGWRRGGGVNAVRAQQQAAGVRAHGPNPTTRTCRPN